MLPQSHLRTVFTSLVLLVGMAFSLRGEDAPPPAEGAPEASAAPAPVPNPAALAQKLFDSGEHVKALTALDALDSGERAAPRTVVLRARILRAIGRDVDALSVVEAALKTAPGDADLLCEKAELCAFTGRYAEAEALFAAAITSRDDHLRARLMQAMLWRELERHASAHEALGWFFDYYAANDPVTAHDITLIGVGGFWGGAPEDGFRILREAMKKDADYYPARVELIRMYLDKGQLPDAERALAEARAVNPNDPETLAMLAMLRTGQRRLALATKMCERTLEINPRSREALMALALLSWIDEDDPAALSRLEEIFAINPDWPPARRLQAGMLFAAGRMEAYEAARERVAAVQENPAQLHADTAGLLMMLNRLDDAVAEYRKAITAQPEHAEALAGLGMALMHLARDEEARPLLDEAFRLDGFNIRTYNERLLLKRNAEYETVASKRFTIRVPKIDAALGWIAAAEADRHITELAARYNWTIPEGLTLMFTRTQADFAARVTGLPRMDANGVCFGHNVLVVSPGDGVRSGHSFNWSDVLRHELAHTVTVTASGYRIPRWLTEGVSVAAQETIDRAWDIPFATAMHENLLPELATFNRWFNRPRYSWQVPAGYHMAGLFVRWFEEEHGAAPVKKLLAAFAEGASIGKAFEDATGQTLAQIETAFHARLREYAKTLPAPPLVDPVRAQALKKAADAKPDHLPTLGAWMPVAWHSGASGEAAAVAEKLVRHAEDYRKAVPAARGPRDLALAYRILAIGALDKDPDAAQKHLEAALALVPDDFATHLVCGHLAMKRERWQDAVDAFEKSLVLYPRYTGPMNAYPPLVAAHDKLEQPPEAADALERYCTTAIDDEDALMDLARRYRGLARVADEERTLLRVFRVNPFHADALTRLARLRADAGQEEESKRLEAIAKAVASKTPGAKPDAKQPRGEAEEFGVHEW